MKIIRHDDIVAANIKPSLCFEWVDEMLKNKETAVLPPKISLHFDDDGFFNTMPCVIPHLGVDGVKVITRKIGRNPSIDSQLLLYDGESRNVKAILDANWLTAMRTGAVAVHSIKALAKKDFKNIGLVGFGNTQTATIKILLDMYRDRELNFSLMKYKEAHVRFRDFILAEAKKAGAEQVSVEYVDDIDELMGNNDIIVSAVTYADKDFCEPTVYKPGVLIVAIHLRGFLHCDPVFDKVFCDDFSHVSGFKYFDKWKYKAEVAQVARGEAKGRESDDERIIAYNVGLSLHDVFFAEKIYEIVGENCSEIELNAPTESVWLMEESS